MKNYLVRILTMLTIVLLGISSAHAGFLKFPAYGYTSSTAPVTSLMDNDNGVSGFIKTYTGEMGWPSNGCQAYVNGQNVACDSSNTNAPRGYKRYGGAQWSTPGINYIDGYNGYMWYDNHSGYDYDVGQWTYVVASASGTIVDINYDYGQVTIDHGNGYRTYYTHMYLLLPLPQTVSKGQHIGWVSNTGTATPHLHFTVKRYIEGMWKPVDPYGGNGQPVLWE